MRDLQALSERIKSGPFDKVLDLIFEYYDTMDALNEVRNNDDWDILQANFKSISREFIHISDNFLRDLTSFNLDEMSDNPNDKRILEMMLLHTDEEIRQKAHETMNRLLKKGS